MPKILDQFIFEKTYIIQINRHKNSKKEKEKKDKNIEECKLMYKKLLYTRR